MKRAIDLSADLVLPLLLSLSAGILAGLAAALLHAVTSLQLLPWIGFAAFLFALESGLFAARFAIRDYDPPKALLAAEVGVMLLLAKSLAALPVTGLLGAVQGGFYDWETYVGLLILGLAWSYGKRTAGLIGQLRPVGREEGQELVKLDDHGQAYEALRGLALGQVGLGALLLSVRAWNGGGAGIGDTLLLLLLALCSAVVVLMAAHLRQRINWAMEGLEVPPSVADRWAPQGLALLLLPLLLALLVPAGPRLPAERLLALFESESQPAPPPAVPPADSSPSTGLPKGLADLAEAQGEPWDLTWLFDGLKVVGQVALVIALLLLLKRAARELTDRAERKGLKGFWLLLATMAGWYEELWRAVLGRLGLVLKQAVAVPAETVGALLSETGAVGRFLPFRGRAPSDPRAAVRYFFARLQADAARRGMPRPAEATAAEFGARLAEVAPERQAEIESLTAAYQEARYSAEPVSPAQVSRVRASWVAIVRALKKR